MLADECPHTVADRLSGLSFFRTFGVGAGVAGRGGRGAVDTRREKRSAMDHQKLKGVVLAVSSSAFIGASFIIKKKGLKRAGSSGLRAGT